MTSWVTEKFGSSIIWDTSSAITALLFLTGCPGGENAEEPPVVPSGIGVNTLVARNYDDIPLIAAIVFYRLYDVTGVVLGWALDALKSGDLRTRLPAGLTIGTVFGRIAGREAARYAIT